MCTVLFWTVGAVLFIISTLVIWLRSGFRNPLRVLRSLCDPIMISFATRSSFAALPASISAMQDDLRFERESVSLMLPLGNHDRPLWQHRLLRPREPVRRSAL